LALKVPRGGVPSFQLIFPWTGFHEATLAGH
jgi:hypothetical protein